MANKYYVDKEQLYLDIVAYQDKLFAAREAGLEDPQMPNSIGKAIMDICNRMGRRGNFSGYTWLDEMISDAMLACVRAIPAFDRNHEKRNPFGFLSLVVWNSFITRLKREKKETDGKMEMLQDVTIETATLDKHDQGMHFNRHIANEFALNSWD